VFPIKDNIPTRRFAILTVLIIVANVVVFFAFEDAKISFSGAQVNQKKVVEYGVIPYEITHPGKECFTPEPQGAAAQVVCDGQTVQTTAGPVKVTSQDIPRDQRNQPPWWVTIFTSMFMHGGILHIAGNMLFFWVFGNNIEDSMSLWRFPIFYLLGGIVAVAGQTLVDPNAAVPTIGASGAIACVLGAYARLYPRARVVTVVFIIIFFTVITLPALWVLGLWFLLQVAYGAADLGQPLGSTGGVAYFAHIGGFLFGLLAIGLFANKVQDDYDRPSRPPVY
jgi:membrane associated rhomboid family serine protease